MSSNRLYLGPYNDPGGPSGRMHWELPHDFDCRNPALVVRKTDRTYSISVEVRNRSESMSATDIVVEIFGVGLSETPSHSGVDGLVADLLSGRTPNRIAPPNTIAIAPASIAPYSLANDCAWKAGPVLFRPMLLKGVVIAAIVRSRKMDIRPTLSQSPTKDPCVAVWIGP